MIFDIILKNNRIKNILLLMSGTSLAQIITVLVAPVLTRLYTPEEFGEYSLYMAISGILVIIFSGSYEIAVPLPKLDKNALIIIFLCFILSLFNLMIFGIVTIIFNDFLLELLNYKIEFKFLILLIFNSFLLAFYQSLNYYFIRKSLFSYLSLNRILQTVLISLFGILFGYFYEVNNGLIISNFIGIFLTFMLLLYEFYKNIVSIKVSLQKMIICALQYKDFLLYNLPSRLFNIASSSIPILMFSKYFGLEFVGLYSVADKCVNLPLSVIGNSISQVYLNEISKKSNDLKSLKKITNIYYKKLLLLSLVFSISFGYADILFEFIFGKEWMNAGKFVSILSPYLCVAFIYSALSSLIYVKNKQRISLFFNIILFSLKIIIIYISYLYNIDIMQMLIMISCVCFICWSIFGMYLLNLALINMKKQVVNYIIYIIIPFSLAIISRIYILGVNYAY